MKEYKRLTKYNEYSHNAEVYAYTAGNTDVYFDGIDIVGNENSRLAQETIDKLAELEDKIENGTLIELPCKVGDTVWTINCWQEYGDTSKGEPYYVTRYEMHENKCSYFEIHEKENYKGQIVIQPKEYFNGVQPYVFLTKAEAEKKLKKVKGE